MNNNYIKVAREIQDRKIEQLHFFFDDTSDISTDVAITRAFTALEELTGATVSVYRRTYKTLGLALIGVNEEPS